MKPNYKTYTVLISNRNFVACCCTLQPVGRTGVVGWFVCMAEHLMITAAFSATVFSRARWPIYSLSFLL